MNFTAHTVQIAHATLQAIEANIEADQGARFRVALGEAMRAAKDPFDGDSFPFRTHLGASIIGRECDRALWYSFHWATKTRHSGRLLRLFNRGHLEEPRFVAMLRCIGCEVWQYDGAGNQFKVAGYGGHFGGSLDCVARGLPEYLQTAVLCEFKTHGAKSFGKLAGSNWQDYSVGKEKTFQGEGVRKAKHDHYVQQQIYMGKQSLPASFYFAVCKDTDAIYCEIVDFDQETFDRYDRRAGGIINTTLIPPKISQDPSWFACKFCEHRTVCHENAAPSQNCRTCDHATPAPDAAGKFWYCHKHACLNGKDAQLAGCELYQLSRHLRP